MGCRAICSSPHPASGQPVAKICRVSPPGCACHAPSRWGAAEAGRPSRPGPRCARCAACRAGALQAGQPARWAAQRAQHRLCPHALLAAPAARAGCGSPSCTCTAARALCGQHCLCTAAEAAWQLSEPRVGSCQVHPRSSRGCRGQGRQAGAGRGELTRSSTVQSLEPCCRTCAAGSQAVRPPVADTRRQEGRPQAWQAACRALVVHPGWHLGPKVCRGLDSLQNAPCRLQRQGPPACAPCAARGPRTCRSSGKTLADHFSICLDVKAPCCSPFRSTYSHFGASGSARSTGGGLSGARIPRTRAPARCRRPPAALELGCEHACVCMWFRRGSVSATLRAADLWVAGQAAAAWHGEALAAHGGPCNAHG